MNGWIKCFTDNSLEVGDDSDKKASWSHGRLFDISSVSLKHENIHIAISGRGVFWQSDDFESTMFEDTSGKLVARRVSKKINEYESILQILQTEHSTMLRVIDVVEEAQSLLSAEHVESIPSKRVGDWLVLEYDIETNKVFWYYSKVRI